PVSRRQPTGEPDGDAETKTSIRSFFLQHIAATWWSALVVYVPLGLAALTAGPVPVVLAILAFVLFVLMSMRFEEMQSGLFPSPDDVWWRRYLIPVFQFIRPRKLLAAILETHLLAGLAVVAAIALPWYLVVSVATEGA